jgi:ribosomal protein S18 acetylase RimI-like enzyme
VADGLHLADATPADAPLIGALLREAFDPFMLESSVYREPSGDVALRRELEQDPADRRRRVRRATIDGRIAGAAIWRSGPDRQLDYVAVAASVGRSGVGNALLEDFEEGAASCALEVFERNDTAWQWYLRHGYQPTTSRAFQVLDLSAAEPAASRSWSVEAFDAADAIATTGVCAVEVARGGAGPVHLLAYGSGHVRLRPGSGLNPELAARLARAVFPDRDRLVVIGGEPAAAELVVDADKLWKMELCTP